MENGIIPLIQTHMLFKQTFGPENFLKNPDGPAGNDQKIGISFKPELAKTTSTLPLSD